MLKTHSVPEYIILQWWDPIFHIRVSLQSITCTTVKIMLINLIRCNAYVKHCYYYRTASAPWLVSFLILNPMVLER